MRKVISKKVIGASLGLLLLASPVTVSAKTGSLESLKSQQKQINTKTTQVQKELSANKSKIHTLTGQITKAQIKIGETQDKMKSLNKKIDSTQKRITKRTNILKQQVKSTYVQSSNYDMVNLLLNSDNFGDLVTRAYAVYRITNQQKKLIDQQVADQKTLQDAKKQLKTETDKTQQTVDQLNQYIADLQSTISNQQDTLNNLQSQKANVNSKIKSLSVQPVMQPVSSKSASKSSASDNKSSNSSSDKTSNSSSESSVPSIAIPKAAVSGNVSDIVANSEKWIGHSTYVFGGGRNSYDQTHGRFDCSGYVHWAYESIGIDIGGWTTSALQYVGTSVSPSNMQPGDLVFFNTYQHNGHVGIYIGNGQFIGSQSSSGVSIESLHNSYWASHFSGTVRRVLN
ncbi:NlpC/P60 family protein [Pullulanibacillus sp. KACC 23026]|uniref:C40 family peptidase n=1 Tax=Pullulanibacillus sp. KACC 23026 TaxID=3028315 RepID=UPI0023B13794|nr:C40 family peptidase [Pullulanibacillus sp. KACC 23026]WEG14112.1 NlpC/P60 family protein [Pullulanibacillus sp. KACC 23026]